MCACYLIYYHDLKPWDAIRIMRRQRPGSVERRTQEDTVVRFYNLLQDYGKSSLEILEEKEKEWLEQQRRQKEGYVNCENLLLVHTASFYGPNNKPETKASRLERIQRMRRCRSMPKMTQEEVRLRRFLRISRNLNCSQCVRTCSMRSGYVLLFLLPDRAGFSFRVHRKKSRSR